MAIQQELQVKFFKKIAANHPDQLIVSELMSLLSLRKGAVYKRMNGETGLLTSELIQIAQHFDVSLDDTFFQERFISFSHPYMRSEQMESRDFLSLIKGYMETLNEEQSSQLVYLCNELPFFYYISKSYIFTFLYSVWNHMHWEEGSLHISNVRRLESDIESLRQHISDYYDNHPVTEIWNPSMFSNLYQQIGFCITIKAFDSPDYVERLLVDIEQLIIQLKDIAAEGRRKFKKKEEPVDLKIYVNEFGSYQNVIIHKGEQVRSTFLGFDYPQFIVTQNDQFYAYASQWINKIQQRSVLISGEAFQYRELFFQQLDKQFLQFKEKVERLMSID